MNIDNNFIILTLIIGICIGYNHMKSQYDVLNNKLNTLEKNAEIKKNIVKQENTDVIKNQKEIVEKINLIDLNRDRDYRAMADPLYPPHARNPYMDRRINIKTRGDGGPYQQIGAIHKEENIVKDGASPGSNSDSMVLPLFGKRTYDGSNQWNYYTVSNNNVKIPITRNNNNCSEDRGCEEFFDNDTLNLPEFNGEFKVKIYNYDKPRYIPYV